MQNLVLILTWLVLLGSRVQAIEPVKIGLIIPLTGDQAVFGVDAQRMVGLVAPAGTITHHGHTFELIVEDGRCGIGGSATSAAQKLINVDQVKFLVVGCSGEAMQVGPIAERNRVVMVAYAASHPGVRDLGEYVFRTYLDISKGVRQMADLIRHEKRHRLAILTEESSFTNGIRDQLHSELRSSIVFNDSFHGGEGEFSALITRARSMRPDAYYLNVASPKHYLALFSQLRRLGAKEPVYSYHAPSDPEVIATLGVVQDGVRYIGTPEVPLGSPAFEEVLRQYRARYPQGPVVEILLRTSYDALFSLIESIRVVGASPPKVRDYLLKYRGVGAVGILEFDSYGDVKHLNFLLKEIRGGVPWDLPERRR